MRLFVELNRTDTPGPFNLMTNFPKKIFTEDDYEAPLNALGMLLQFIIFNICINYNIYIIWYKH